VRTAFRGTGTLREAMRILQATDLLNSCGRGAFVARTRELNKEDVIQWFKENEIEIKDILEVRAAIERLPLNCNPALQTLRHQ
jgi:GntR family transcriptional repressor for pyruvate dehydrogenase complex